MPMIAAVVNLQDTDENSNKASRTMICLSSEASTARATTAKTLLKTL